MKITSSGLNVQELMNKEENFNRQLDILSERMDLNHSISKPKVGDFVLTSEGEYLRITVMHGENFQANNEGGSYHLFEDGYLSMSGACGNSYQGERLSDNPSGYREGSCWFFYDGNRGAHRGVECRADFRVWDLS
tara:strand:+ start:4818 stop:5222 length:405 start_codon:yes stop_codon:yes gene_type:complete